MDRKTTLLVAGLAAGAVGGLVFYGGLRLMDRQRTQVGGIGSCLLALLGALVIFLALALLLTALFLP